MVNVSYDEKKQEAIQRLKMMGVDNRMVIKPFKKGKLMLSEYLDEFFPAVLYDANQYTYWLNRYIGDLFIYPTLIMSI